MVQYFYTFSVVFVYFCYIFGVKVYFFIIVSFTRPD